MIEHHRYRIDVADEILVDLADRLARTRWPIEPVAAPWRYGTDLTYLKAAVAHWRHHYDWRVWEARLNRFAQYRVPIDGMHLHVIVEPGSGAAPMPLVLLNGWPSSIAEFIEVIEPLAHPERYGGDIADAFTVIVPSYPGFGFSDPPSAPLGARAVAGKVQALLDAIIPGQRYFVHGGDWGAIIASWMAFDAPDRVMALHLNSAALRPAHAELILKPEEQAYLDERARRLTSEAGYQAIQGTRPQTLSYGLTDSPAGLAGWILEKFKAWVVPGSDEAPPFDLDVLLTNVMIYWLNGINAANWMYCDLPNGAGVTLRDGERIAVPTALFMGDRDLPPVPPDSWVRRSYDLVELRVMPGMGHFPSIESAADAQIEHLRAFFARYRPK